METINIRDCFPILSGSEGVILSKRGDICVGWEVTLPPSFRLNEEKYDSVIASMAGAIGLLPDYTVVHKQDIFMRKKYTAEKATGFLEEAYERHFDGREYLDHKCLLWLCFSNKKHIRGAGSGLLGISADMLSTSAVGAALQAAAQFEAMTGLEMRRLTDEDIFGVEGRPGILQDYLNFTDEGPDQLADIQVEPGAMVMGGKRVVCHLLSDLDQLPGEVSSCRRVPELSTEHSTVALSYLHELGDRLPCEHVVNWFCVKEPMQDLHGKLDSKRRQMQSMSLRNAQNRKYAEEINEYLEKASVEQMTTVRCHLNVFSTDEHATTSAISRLGLVPVRDMSNAPAQMWASIPGNESGLAYTEYMTLELRPALCLWICDGFEPGIPGGVLKMSDRIRLVPLRFDIQEKALEQGLIVNYNVFLLGPSGSGKSFFMNKYLRACYIAGQHCFL
ncbi:MAG: TraG family conjugative transposon ATPase, partial [Bacteroidales bacterium]|nr:TraG family conjugative transposon ATPase [Bacteroidales bacterium]